MYVFHVFLLHEFANMNREYLHLGTKKKKKSSLASLSDFFKSGKLFSKASIEESNETRLDVLLL